MNLYRRVLLEGPLIWLILSLLEGCSCSGGGRRSVLTRSVTSMGSMSRSTSNAKSLLKASKSSLGSKSKSNSAFNSVLKSMKSARFGFNSDKKGLIVSMNFEPRPILFWKFGCGFENDNYLASTESIFYPKYGTENIETPMEFESEEDFRAVLKVIEEQYKKILKEFIIETKVPFYFDLYQAYPNYHTNQTSSNETDDAKLLHKLFTHPNVYEYIHMSRMTSMRTYINENGDEETVDDGYSEEFIEFWKFFRNYEPKLHAGKEEIGMTMELLNRLIEIKPQMRHCVHLIDCSLTTEKKMFDFLNLHDFDTRSYKQDFENRKRREVPRGVNLNKQHPPIINFDHAHVAALFRFRIQDRMGYVLMDPGFEFDQPLVLMLDGESPHMPYVYKNGKFQWIFHLPESDFSDGYVLAKSVAKYPTPGLNEPLKLLYFIDQPYCSFLTTTLKASLLSSSLAITRRESSGFPREKVSFHLMVENGEWFYKYVSEASDSQSETQITKFRAGMNRNETEVYHQIFQDMIKKMDYQDLIPDLKKLVIIIEEDPLFPVLLNAMEGYYYAIKINSVPKMARHWARGDPPM